MNLDSNTAPVPSTRPSRVAAIHGMAEWLTRRCTSVMARPVLRSYQARLSTSVAFPSWTMRLPDRSSGSASPRFSRQSRTRAASSLPMMIRASDPPMKTRRSTCSSRRLIRPSPLCRRLGIGRHRAISVARQVGNEFGRFVASSACGCFHAHAWDGGASWGSYSQPEPWGHLHWLGLGPERVRCLPPACITHARSVHLCQYKNDKND